MQKIYVENQSSVIDGLQYRRLLWALDVQLYYQFNRSPWGIQARIRPLASGEKVPKGGYNLILLDHSTEAGALGYHEDEAGTDIPFSDVFCITARENGTEPSAVASHEALEMLVNFDVSEPRTVTHDNKLYIVEVCDPCESNSYDVGDPQGRSTGIMVSDFCYPAWYGIPNGPNFPENQMSYRKSVSNSFELAKEGYCSTAPVSDPSNWSQTFGEHKNRLPEWSSRLPRIHSQQ